MVQFEAGASSPIAMRTAIAPDNRTAAGPAPKAQPIACRWIALVAACLLPAAFATYTNHFQNDFHFDDSHVVHTNPFIRSVSIVAKESPICLSLSVFPFRFIM